MKKTNQDAKENSLQEILDCRPLWEMNIVEVAGHNLESRGREEVNRLLQNGWRLLLIYTLSYRDEGIWRQRPMAILGKLATQAAGGETRRTFQDTTAAPGEGPRLVPRTLPL